MCDIETSRKSIVKSYIFYLVSLFITKDWFNVTLIVFRLLGTFLRYNYY